MPKLSQYVHVDYFWDNMDLLRKEHRIISEEFTYYTSYPRHDMKRYHEALDLMNEWCKKSDVTMQCVHPAHIELNESNWADFRKIVPVARYWFEGIEITKLLDL